MTKGLSPSLVGLSAPAFERRVEWKAAAAYAAGTFDPNPRYLDDRQPEELVAPPMFAAALTVSGNAEIGARVLEASGLSRDAFARQVHYSEVIEFNRPLRIGMTLSITPSVAAIRPHRQGTEFVLRFEASAEGEPVFREYLSTLVRDVFNADSDNEAALPDVPVIAQDGRTEDDASWSEDEEYGVLDAHIYDACSGISYPVHTSPATAEKAGLAVPLVHGTAILARCLRHLVDRELAGDPRRISRISARFSGMVLPGTTVRTCGFADPLGFLVVDAVNKTPILRHGRIDLSA